MKKMLITLFSGFIFLAASGQDSSAPAADPALALYRGSYPHINDLVHTRLDVRFDYAKSYLYGKAWITLKPHFYPTDSLSLDARGMDLKAVSVMKGKTAVPLKYTYDGASIRVHLDKTYHTLENYTIYIDYTAKPDELASHGSDAIKNDKGLYFINPLGKDKDKATQIWTQGETEANSAWFPTIDKPNQKCTEEISMTVPDKYVTLSNGRLADQKKNPDGTRTDTWKMELPNAPYLFFMGVGDFAIVKDSYKGKEVSYYVEKEYAPVARKIFGFTPEMIAFYSRILGVEYPWNKYSQMTGEDYVSGAMENTSATLQTSAVQQDARELTDGNKYEDYVAHELFHQWFGDLVTTESWSNLTVNESFANFSETLWNEYKHGKDAGDATNYKDIEKYLADPENPSKDLVRFHYKDKEDMFDMVTYSKGGRILNMLRYYVGDSAFFRSLNLYLTSHKFGNGEAQDLRLAFEQVTGEDLNWYWNQWYYGSGHPKLEMTYGYDDGKKTATVIVKQVQNTGKIFRVPLAIDVYEGAAKNRHREWLGTASDTFRYQYKTRPDLINVDGEKIVLCEKNDAKTLANFIFQYKKAGLYLDRREAIDYCAAHQDSAAAVTLLKTALQDPYGDLRIYTMDALNLEKEPVKDAVRPVLEALADKDSQRLVQSKALELLGAYHDPAYKALFARKCADSSYSVAGNALRGLSDLDQPAASLLAEQYSQKPVKGELLSAVVEVFVNNGDTSKNQMVVDGFAKMPMSQNKMNQLPHFAVALLKISDDQQVKKGVDAIVAMCAALPRGQRKELTGLINDNILKPIAERKAAAGLKVQADYINEKIK